MSEKLRRIGLLGDIHAEDCYLERALDCLTKLGVDILASTGDIADGRGSVERCCTLLESYRVVTVAGNHERWLLSNTLRDLPYATALALLPPATRRYLESLPRMVELETVTGRALLCHGIGPHDMARVLPDDSGYALESNLDLMNLLRNPYYRWILNGHSHRSMVRHFDGLGIINGGTLAPEQGPEFLRVDFETQRVEKYLFDSEGKVKPTPICFSLRSDVGKPKGRGR